MSYIGNSLPANFQSLPAVQRFNGDGSDTTFTLAAQIANDRSILVSVDGVTQDDNAYAVNGTTLTFTAAPSAGTGNIFVHTISPVGSTVVPPDGSVSTVKLVDGSVTGAKIGSNPFMFWGRQASDQTITRNTATTITGMTNDEVDPSTAFNGSVFTVPSGGAGVYMVMSNCVARYDGIGNDGEVFEHWLYANGEKLSGRFQNATNRDTVMVSSSLQAIAQLSVGNTIFMQALITDANGGNGKTRSSGTTLGAYRIST